MAAPEKPTLSERLRLNLLYPQGVNVKLPVKFLKWLIAYGRYIVVVVEIIVLACFAMRFKLDEDLNNLKENINSQVPFLQNLVTDDTLNNQTHHRLDLIKKTYAEGALGPVALKKIADQIPTAAKLTNISLDLTQEEGSLFFKINAVSFNTNDVALFLSGLKGEPNLSEINLASLTFDQGNLNFTITGKLKL